MKELRDLANDHGLRVHLDGARIFNAAVALRVPVTEFTQYVDTVMFCLSKGLGAPVGSILASDKHTISTARHLRKMLGGGMRRSGFLAAAGLIALRTGINQLEIDHLNACKLAALLSDIPFIKVDCEHVQTNMVMVDVEPSGMTAEEVGDLLKERGIKVSVRPPYLLRSVTHKDITTKMIDEAVSEVKDLFRNIR
jgi:threonine aldolase